MARALPAPEPAGNLQVFHTRALVLVIPLIFLSGGTTQLTTLGLKLPGGFGGSRVPLSSIPVHCLHPWHPAYSAP